MKRVFCICLCIVYIASLSGCHGVRKEADSQETDQGNRPDQLVVYLSAPPHVFSLSDDENDPEKNFTCYPSRYTIGTMGAGGEVECSGGNIFAQALKEYEEETGIKIEIHYIEEYSGESDALQVLYESGAEMPDLMIMGKHPHYDYYRLAEQNFLLDFSAYIEMDEELRDSEKYYTNVLEGGKIKEKQYGLPILFNMNGLITRSSFLEEVGIDFQADYATFEDIMHLLKSSCIEMKDTKAVEAIYETSGYMIAGRYLPSILTGAAYPSYFDESMNIMISQETLISIFEMMDDFNQQEFMAISNWQNKPYYENGNNMQCKSRNIPFSSDVYDRIGIFLTGGRCGGVNFHNSLLTDYAFFRTVYKNHEEEMVFCGIPTVESPDSYSANISLTAFGFQSTKYPEAVYELARYMMDYEYPSYYGFSVNKELTGKQLEDIQNTTLKVYPEYVWSGIESGVNKKEDVEKDCFIIEPLDADSVQMIQNMLDHIEGAGIPYNPLEYVLYSSALSAIGNGQMKPEEVAQWVMEHLTEHIEIQKELKPFYDADYNRSLRLD